MMLETILFEDKYISALGILFNSDRIFYSKTSGKSRILPVSRYEKFRQRISRHYLGIDETYGYIYNVYIIEPTGGIMSTNEQTTLILDSFQVYLTYIPGGILSTKKIERGFLQKRLYNE